MPCRHGWIPGARMSINQIGKSVPFVLTNCWMKNIYLFTTRNKSTSKQELILLGDRGLNFILLQQAMTTMSLYRSRLFYCSVSQIQPCCIMVIVFIPSWEGIHIKEQLDQLIAFFLFIYCTEWWSKSAQKHCSTQCNS